MALHFRPPAVFCVQHSKSNGIILYLGSLAVLLALAHAAAAEPPKHGVNSGQAQPCESSILGFADLNDARAPESYEAKVAEILKQGRFKDLDCLADNARSSKERFAGGMWKIHAFYVGATELQGHPTEPDWQSHLKQAQRWIAERKQSVTARVALAEIYIGYAWAARGSDTSDTVTDNGWELFNQRLALAKATLDEASTHGKCPEWFLAMQQVALGQGWDKTKATDLLRKATAFEPDYYYYYRVHAYYLLPKWNGEDGDAARFAAESADRLGGDAGDILYFQIGVGIVCACDEPEFGHLSWPRLQAGYAQLEKKYGMAPSQLNPLALMATKSGDAATADEAFKKIGDNWDRATWMTEAYFNQNKKWAAQMGPAEMRSRAILQQAEANLQSPEGVQYQKSVEQALIPRVRQCSQSESSDQAEFVIMVQVGKDGVPDDAWPRRVTSTAQCVLRQLYDSHVKKEAAFPPPPHPAYWLKIQMDPAAVSSSAAN
jgi:hypothetical protein